VAGVAHELNNPIGFIYSNMGNLKDYADRLSAVAQLAKTNPDKVQAKWEQEDVDYILEDLPKLIKSCEDGARRTRDTVLGLRNFSRLDEAQLKEVDIHEGIDTTLQLIYGEIKNRIEVVTDYGSLPKIKCYPSQLN